MCCVYTIKSANNASGRSEGGHGCGLRGEESWRVVANAEEEQKDIDDDEVQWKVMMAQRDENLGILGSGSCRGDVEIGPITAHRISNCLSSQLQSKNPSCLLPCDLLHLIVFFFHLCYLLASNVHSFLIVNT